MKTCLSCVSVIAGLLAVEPSGYLRTAFPTQRSLIDPATQLPVDQFVTHIYRVGVSNDGDDRFSRAIGAAMAQLERERLEREQLEREQLERSVAKPRMLSVRSRSTDADDVSDATGRR